MYAVIETGGKQYRVEVGTELQVELLDVEPGQSITLERVLLVADGTEAAVGTPVVADAAVEAEVVGRDRGEKVIAFKYRPKARRRVKKGHRQDYTVLRIADIRFNGKSAAASDAQAKELKKTERQRLQEAAARQAAEDAALAAKLSVGAPAVGTPAADAPAPKRGKARTSDATAAKAASDEAPAAAPKARAKAATPAKKAAAPGDKAAAAAKKATPAKKAAAPADKATDAAAPKRTRIKKDE
jgi:large subunit ribosomal protein L21